MTVSFPVFNSSTKVVNSDGFATKEFINFLSLLEILLNDVLSGNGIKPPEISTQTETQIEANGKNVLRSFVFNKDTNEHRLLTENAGVFKFKDILVGP